MNPFKIWQHKNCHQRSGQAKQAFERLHPIHQQIVAAQVDRDARWARKRVGYRYSLVKLDTKMAFVPWAKDGRVDPTSQCSVVYWQQLHVFDCVHATPASGFPLHVLEHLAALGIGSGVVAYGQDIFSRLSTLFQAFGFG
jgi:hypothetical protein